MIVSTQDLHSTLFQYMQTAGDLAHLVIDQPLEYVDQKDGHIHVRRGDTTVAVLHDENLKQMFTRLPGMLRTLAEAVSTVYVEHKPQRGVCRSCGQPVRCETWRLITVFISDLQPALRVNEGVETALIVKGRLLATLHDPALADFVNRAPTMAQMLSAVLAAVDKTHRESDGICASCRTTAPCRTRQLLDSHARPGRRLDLPREDQ